MKKTTVENTTATTATTTSDTTTTSDIMTNRQIKIKALQAKPAPVEYMLLTEVNKQNALIQHPAIDTTIFTKNVNTPVFISKNIENNNIDVKAVTELLKKSDINAKSFINNNKAEINSYEIDYSISYNLKEPQSYTIHNIKTENEKSFTNCRKLIFAVDIKTAIKKLLQFETSLLGKLNIEKSILKIKSYNLNDNKSSVIPCKLKFDVTA